MTVGKRKRAIARAVFKKGKGNIMINKIMLENINPELVQLKIKEPVLLAPEVLGAYDVSVKVRGGGRTGQADAARQAIARGIVKLCKKTKDIEEIYDKYNKNLLVTDSRRNEVSKQCASSRGPRRKIQLSKR
ncbi:MAG: 30S ribosomal protein S9 [Candidatus Nanohalarchaeota archaeon]|nr:MAG: 30S ribosomal protein S9 [Candidatus Nanohaloarchaeota archaeon]